MRYQWLAIATAVGCGDNSLPVGAPLVHARDLTIVAHADDDLVFMQPDLLERTLRGGATNLYLSDGNESAGLRHLGLMAAYSAVTGLDGWECGWLEIANHAAEHCRLKDAHLSLVFLGYPESDPNGNAPQSLRRLWDGSIDIAITIGDRPASYDRADLVRVVTEVIELTQPQTIRTLELASTHGLDHTDHVITGAVTLLAVAASQSNPELIAFRGESTDLEAPNVIEPLFARSATILGHYAACAEGCGVCGESCPSIDDERAAWLRRRYAVSLRRTAAGELRSGTDCIVAEPGGELVLGACGGDPWQLAADGTLHVGDRCIGLLSTGELGAGASCGPDRLHRFFFDDEGHIWIGVPPAPASGGPLQCLVLEDGRPHVTRCGPELAPTWELSPAPTATPRPAGLAGTGRAVRLADLDGDRRADLCEINDAGKLACAKGNGAGGFAPAIAIRALPVEPESLVIGDVDGDGLADACGRDVGGILCATAAAGFGFERWTPAFAHVGPADATDRSLAAIDSDDNGSAEICGLAFNGVVCAQHDLSGLPVVRSPWPDRSATLWPADLDGDRRADWCVETSSGAACGLDLHRTLTTDGVPWSFSQHGVVDRAPTSAATGALADIDGDGRADLCSIRDRRIVCARSQGYGFGPVSTLATLPVGARPTALWLGDLDGNGTADACVDDAGTIRCVRSD